MPRKKSTEQLHDLHVQVNKRIQQEARKRAKSMGLSMRTAVEEGLKMFVAKSYTNRSKLAS